MEKPMNHQRLPQTDSIQELANFWDGHDLTDFEDELEEVAEPVFERDTDITVHLQSDDASALRALANARGMAESELIRQWVLERIHAT
jgi:predicted DNA binding CopG/RHH family protein